MEKRIYSLLFLAFLTSAFTVNAQNNTLEFDGTDDYVLVSDDNSLDFSSAMTIEFWIKPSKNSGMTLISKSISDADENYRVYIDPSTNLIYFDYGNINQYSQTTDFTVNLNVWYHMAFTVTAGGQGHIYVNGTEASTYTNQAISANPIATNSAGMYIGCRGWDQTINFDGKLDEIRIWNDIRTSNEIRQNMYRELVNPTSEANLVAYFQMNSDLNDASSNTNNGVFNGGTASYSTSPAMFGPKNALDFDGIDDYVHLKGLGVSTVSGAKTTVEFWMYWDGTYASMPFGWTGYDLYFYSSSFGFNTGAGDLRGISATNLINKWIHVAAVFVNNTTTDSKLYLNGIEQTLTQILNTPTTKVVTDSAGIGTWGYFSGEYFGGKIDELRIWNGERTETEIRENMCKTLTGNESGLLAYYNFDNTGGTTLQDFSGNEIDGTLNNMNVSTDWVTSTAFNTWLNTSSSSWSTTTNWSMGSKPLTESIGIYSYTGGTVPAITTSDEAAGGNIVVDLSSDWSISGSFDVFGNLIIESDINLNGHVITMGPSAYLIEDAGKIYGTSGNIQTTRSLSNINAENIAGLGAEITTSANMGSTTITRYPSAVSGPGNNESIKRYYKISPTTNTGLNATLVFHYDDSELNGNTESNLVLFRSTDNGITWTEKGGIVNTTENTITLSGINGFSLWAADETGSILPIELLDFTANCLTLNKNSIAINWTTTSETNNSHFEIQQSFDAESFNTIASVKGAGNSNDNLNYRIIVENNENRTTYYRLKQVDFDGKFSYSKTISINCNKKGISDLEIFPNPFTNEISINFNTKLKNDAKIEIRNNLGVLVKEEKLKAYQNIYTIKLDENLADGIYYVTIYNQQEIIVKKLFRILYE